MSIKYRLDLSTTAIREFVRQRPKPTLRPAPTCPRTPTKQPKGGGRKVPYAVVCAIREDHARGATHGELGRKYGQSTDWVRRVVNQEQRVWA